MFASANPEPENTSRAAARRLARVACARPAPRPPTVAAVMGAPARGHSVMDRATNLRCGYDPSMSVAGVPGSLRVAAEQPDRNLALELVRVTEAAAMAADRWVGRGDKNGADASAVSAMRQLVSTVSMKGVVVIGEGEKDEAPMLYNGEEVGDG